MYYSVEEDVGLLESDKNDLLNDFSSDIIIDNLKSQIDNIYESIENNDTMADLFIIIKERYLFLHNKYEKIDDFIDELENIMNNILNEIQHKIEDKFSFSIDISEALMLNDKINYINSLYSFFIVNIQENFENLFYSYFKTNLKGFMENNKIKKNKANDVYYKYLSESIKTEYIPIIYNLDDILHSISNEGLLAEDIIELMIKDDEYEFTNYFIGNIFLNNLFCDISYDEFTKIILDLANKSSNTLYKVKNKIINEFKK